MVGEGDRILLSEFPLVQIHWLSTFNDLDD